MAFNQGPQPEIVLNENGVRYVDPNPTDEIVNHEDLVMYVKLVARAKGRSILTYDQDTEQQTVIVEQKNVQSETNFTYQTGKEYLDTSWTNIGGGNINFGEDLGSFGITNIGIEFKSSFMPQIVIDFVDVRGAALFEQGPCSPYAIFFHLPYPVFELTVKGYYGRPVTYTLALIKFNTKFNSETGNFESKAEFVGYTYAFLADIPMGYVMAANFMTKPHDGKTILAEKWKQLIEKKILDNSFTNENEPLSVYDLIKKSKQLEQRTQELKGLASVKQLGQINSTKNQLDSLRNIVSEFEGKLRSSISKSINSGFDKNKVFFIKLPNTPDTQQSAILTDVKAIITEYLGDGNNLGGKIGTEVSTVNTYYTTNSIGDSPNINIETIKNNTKGFLNQTIGQEDGLSKYSIDFEESFYKPLNIASKSLSKQQITKKDEVKNTLNAEVIKTLGFLPTISNVFAIILTNVEVFLELLLRTSRDAEKYHEENDVTTGLGDSTTQNLLELRNKPTVGAQLSDEASTNKPIKVYPWPTYYVQKAPASETNPDSNVSSNSSEVGTKEAYPGENPEFTSWPEVVFVENFIKALTRLKTELQVLELEKENLPGYDNFAPITAYETHAFGNANAPNRWYRAQQADGGKWVEAIYKIMGENAFILGDYTMINTLSLWKSQLGFKNGWGVSSLTNYQGSGNGYIPASSNGFNVGPQRLVNNPLVISNLNQPELNRYPNISNKGFNYISYGSDAKDREVESFRKKIIPTTRARMKKWGYIDALNLMTTVKLDGGDTTILSFLKQNITDKETVKKQIKTILGEKFKTQKFDEWKVSATQEISGTTALIDNQNSIWGGHFGYVKNKNVLSYKGPIILNSQIDEGKNIEIHANPHLNEGQGAILTTTDALAGREIDFSSESLTDNIKKKYTEYFADVSTNESKINEDVATPNSLAYTTLKYRPKPSTIKSKTSYDNYSLERSNINLIRDKNTNLLSLGENFYPNFFHKYEDNEGLESSKIILDLSSSRRYISQKNGNTTEKWARFMGAPETDDLGFANSIINTPLWTLNYPLYKNAWNWSKAGGNSYIGLDETIKTSNLNLPESYSSNIYKNTKRNWGTWWGINQWGVDNNTDYYKPLAYIAVMSFGFRNQNTNYRSGHFLPWDGEGDYDLSSFSNFTHTAIVANLPKSYVLLIGALLWRMKESGLLRWDDIKPKRNTIDSNNKGWNTFDKSYLGAAGNVGIDDLNDPVWFFHTSTSRPLYGGGSVYANNDGFDIKQSPFTDGKGKYQRKWINRTNGIDNWTNGGGSINSSLSLDTPVTITNWTKGQFVFGDEKSEFKNRARGFYDLCRPDQIPFLISSGDDFKTPNTLAIVEKTEEVKNPPSNVNTSLSRLPNLKFDNGTGSTSYIKTTYPVLKEECKELMFIPKSLKEQFIQVFENWSTNDTKWLATIDPLNWTDDGKLENFTTTTTGNVNTAYKVSGYRGFLNQETYSKSRNFGKVINDEKKDFGFSKFDFEDNNNIGSNQKKTKKTNKNNNSSEENIPSGGGSEGIEQAGGIGNSFCFVAGTKIKLVDGSSVNIEDLNIDKKLLTYNLDTKEFEEGDIGEIQVEYKENLVTYYFDNGNKINCTEDHPIWVIGKGWSSYRAYNFTEDNTHNINTKEIIIGDECLYYSDGKFNKVKLNKIIRKNNRPTRVWRIKNLNVNKNFIAGNVLVYN